MLIKISITLLIFALLIVATVKCICNKNYGPCESRRDCCVGYTCDLTTFETRLSCRSLEIFDFVLLEQSANTQQQQEISQGKNNEDTGALLLSSMARSAPTSADFRKQQAQRRAEREKQIQELKKKCEEKTAKIDKKCLILGYSPGKFKPAYVPAYREIDNDQEEEWLEMLRERKRLKELQQREEEMRQQEEQLRQEEQLQQEQLQQEQLQQQEEQLQQQEEPLQQQYEQD